MRSQPNVHYPAISGPKIAGLPSVRHLRLSKYSLQLIIHTKEAQLSMSLCTYRLRLLILLLTLVAPLPPLVTPLPLQVAPLKPRLLKEGLGVDWGPTFTQGWRPDVPRDHSPPSPRSCSLLVVSVTHLAGTCGQWGGCRVGTTTYLGRGCHTSMLGRLRSASTLGSGMTVPCQVERQVRRMITGVCTWGGHCQRRDRRRTLHHEDCKTAQHITEQADKIEKQQNSQPKMKIDLNISKRPENSIIKSKMKIDMQKRLEDSNQRPKPVQSSKCRELYTSQQFERLSFLCKKCQRNSNDTNTFYSCMQNCFNTPLFFNCVKSIIK